MMLTLGSNQEFITNSIKGKGKEKEAGITGRPSRTG
jgi:hypothetical protein